MTSGAVSGSWIVGHRLSGRVKSCLQGSRDRKLRCSWHWEKEPRDNEAVKDSGTGTLCHLQVTASWVDRTHTWTSLGLSPGSPGVTGTVQTPHDQGCSLHYNILCAIAHPPLPD